MKPPSAYPRALFIYLLTMLVLTSAAFGFGLAILTRTVW